LFYKLLLTRSYFLVGAIAPSDLSFREERKMAEVKKTETAAAKEEDKKTIAAVKENAEKAIGEAAGKAKETADAVKKSVDTAVKSVKKAAPKTRARKTEKKAANESLAKKTVEKIEQAEKKVEAMKEEIKKEAAPVKEEIKKAAEKKPVGRKAAVKKAEEPKREITAVLQYMGREFSFNEILKKADTVLDREGRTAADVKLYVKPEDGRVYYVINDGEDIGSFEL
jgi:hypothetical protein